MVNGVERQPGGRTSRPCAIGMERLPGHNARAKAAGAEIVLDLKSQDYGGRDYTCRDLEGHAWTFGTYDPWAA
jgi:uncharacterized glyoxalase superfamily protein PhnB